MDSHRGRDNNLNLIRALAASAVVVSHSFALSTGEVLMEPLRRISGASLGEVAVDVFFVISGFLISKSAMERGVLQYARARLLRIYPGLLAMLAALFVLAVCTTSLPVRDFLSSDETVAYFTGNAILFLGVMLSLPGMFEGNPFPYAMNGSLWTLVIELRLYVLLALSTYALRGVGADARAFRWLALAFLAGAAASAVYWSWSVGLAPYSRLTLMFAAGSFLYHWRVPLGRYNVAAVALAVVVVSLLAGPEFRFAYLAALPYAVMSLAFMPSTIGSRYNRIGDYSYGIYIYSFPIQQLVVHLVPGISAAALLALSLPLSIAAGAVSWHLIEKPAMAWRRKPRAALEPHGAS